MGPASHSIRLEGDRTIRDASLLAADLAGALRTEAGLRVETSALASADAGILQVLVAAHRTARRLQKPLAVEVPPGGALEAALAAGGFLADGVISLEGGSWTGLCDA